ncbi:hypothetical protein BACCELL_00640 [Bacteroides cellulosilyticus DSM 14838]|uniref:Uncharacterized protein n=1 Tax=Bacteroides cellulosilyticus DSM 14838 TaxID=537012 RepID=E2N8P5_9BACE|nr:hypothetical protein BACCELL_00640 [Bacteroides cellulosilyticus DSM 14838]
MGGDAYIPQSVGHFGGEDEDEALGFVYGDILHGHEYFLGGCIHGGEGDADGGVGACQFDVSSGESDVLAGLRGAGGGAVGGAGLSLGAVQQRAYHGGLGEYFELALVHGLAQARAHAEAGVDFHFVTVGRLGEVGTEHGAAGSGLHQCGGGGYDVTAAQCVALHFFGGVEEGVDFVFVLSQAEGCFTGHGVQIDGLGHGFDAEVVVVRAFGQRGVVGHEADQFGKTCR